MTRGLSLWLDALRVAATLIVVFSHVAYARFTRGDYEFVRELNVGSDAVIVFFVISGLVIAFAAERDKTLGTYAFNRLTRLLSVLLPALVLTFALDHIGHPMDASAYPDRFYQPLPLWEMLARGLTMSNEWGLFDRVRLGTNGPLWSLSYEAAYYVLFGVAVFCTGARPGCPAGHPCHPVRPTHPAADARVADGRCRLAIRQIRAGGTLERGRCTQPRVGWTGSLCAVSGPERSGHPRRTDG